jgi:acyl carrier protein
MTADVVRAQLREFVISNFYLSDPDAFDDAVSLLRAGIIDSTGVLELVTHVEREYGINVPDDDLVPANFDSINALVEFVQRKRA